MNKPFLDRNILINEITSFTRQYNAYFKQQTGRMSDFYEMSVYNEIVRYYKKKSYDTIPCNLKNGVFLYRLTTAGLKDNFSYFKCDKSIRRGFDKNIFSVEIHHNLRIQSANHNDLYYNADVSICHTNTVCEQITGRCRINYIPNRSMISFFEVKNLNPFPEILYNFSGLLLEFSPLFIHKKVIVKDFDPDEPNNQHHLCPGIFFSGTMNRNTQIISNTLRDRYGHNIICGLAKNKGTILGLRGLKEYSLLECK